MSIFQEMRPFYFVTFNTRHRRKILAVEVVHTRFVEFCERAYSRHQIAVGCYVIMPDHIHLFVAMPPDMKLSRWIQSLKNFLGKELLREEESLWQDGFFDHLLRSGESYSQKWEYVRENPVRAGLCAQAEDWKFRGEIISISF